MKNSVIFITGTNRERGIGRALVEEAIKRGAKKVYATARDTTQLDNLLKKHDGKVVAIELDVTDGEAIERVIEQAGDTQILINNAGTCGFHGCLENYDEAAARRDVEVNFFAPLHLMRAFAKNLIKNKPAAIANVVSIAGLSPYPPAAVYSASKAALHSLTQTVRAEMAPHGIPVYGIYPGPIDTDMINAYDWEKESPDQAAARVFDGIEQGRESITTDAVSDTFAEHLRRDSDSMHRMSEDF